MPKATRRAFSIVLHPGTPGGAPCGAQHLFFRLGKLFQGGFPLQGGTFIGAALGIGQLNGTFGVGILGTGLAALVGAQAAGKVKVIGVSNFLQDDLENLLGSCRVMPMVNQILLHITNTDSALVDFCKAQGIQVEAYSPIAHGEALKNPAIVKMAEKYGVSAAQLCIRYVLQLGAVALPKTADPAHMESNADVDFAISEEDMETLKNMERIANYGEFSAFPVFSGKPLA